MRKRWVLLVAVISGIALLPLVQPGRALATSGYSTSSSPTLTELVVTSDTASTSPNASVRGHAVTLTAVVVPVAPNLTSATGSVTFFANGSAICTAPVTPAAAGGEAQCVVTSLASGSSTLTAHYNGDTNNQSSDSGGQSHTVQPRTVTFSGLANTSGWVTIDDGHQCYLQGRFWYTDADDSFHTSATISSCNYSRTNDLETEINLNDSNGGSTYCQWNRGSAPGTVSTTVSLGLTPHSGTMRANDACSDQIMIDDDYWYNGAPATMVTGPAGCAQYGGGFIGCSWPGTATYN